MLYLKNTIAYARSMLKSTKESDLQEKMALTHM